MVDKLWAHALQFLDRYRLSSDVSGCNVSELYKFPDQTGILDIHGRWLAHSFMESEVDIKILYYELIRMITNYDRETCRDPEIYDRTRSISKIEGYQDLTNRLQRIMNQQFMLHIDELNRKCEEKNVALTNGHGLQNDDDKLGKLEEKVEKIILDNQKLREDVQTLSARNQVLEKEISDLKHKLEEKQPGDFPNLEKNQMLFSGESDTGLSDNVNVLNEHIARVSDKMQSIISQANTLLINDATQLERISNLETQLAEIDGKLSHLESADLYLQEAHKVLTERTSLIEKYSKYIEEKVKLVSSQSLISSVETDDTSRYQQLDQRVTCLERSHLAREKFNENYINMSKRISEESNSITQLSINVLDGKIKDSKMNSLSNYDELVDKYKLILNRIQTMESLLTEQSQTISDHSRIFSDKYFKSSVPADKVKENRITKMVTEKISEIRREEERSFMNIRDITKLNQANTDVFEFIEMLVTMNKSLNNMTEESVITQNQLKTLKTDQSTTLEELSEHEKILKSHSDRFSLLHEKLELADIKELCDYENLNQKNHQIEENFLLLKKRVTELEKMKNINKIPLRALEEDFSIRRRSYEKLLGSANSKKSNGKLFGLFGGKKGSCCC